MVRVEQTEKRKQKPDFSNLGFGKYFSDYMFRMDYTEGQGWHDARVIPYAPFVLDPATSVFHYAQCIFEGLKAYKTKDNGISLFRPKDNFARLNRSCERMCIPKFDEAIALEGLFELLKLDKDWIPSSEGASLYIRPTVIATDEQVGLKTCKNYIFYIILSPVGTYYANGLEPVKIYVEHKYVRAAIGGTGDVKCGANYAISMKAADEAKKKGFDQVLWLDAKERKYAEEVGSMNIFFVLDGEVVTPELSGSILPGITRDSLIKVLKSEGVKVSERKVSVNELISAAKEGRLTECFGAGTAAVVSPVGSLHYESEDILVGDGKMGKITQHLYDTLTGIQYGKIKDPFNWVMEVK